MIRRSPAGIGSDSVEEAFRVSPHLLAVRPEKDRVHLYGGRAVPPPVWSSYQLLLYCRPLWFLAPQQPPLGNLQLTWATRSPGMIDNLVVPCFDSIFPHNPHLTQPNFAPGKASNFHNFAKSYLYTSLSPPAVEVICGQKAFDLSFIPVLRCSNDRLGVFVQKFI